MKDIPIRLGPLALLLTVISICMTTLAILTFTTARADWSLASTFANTVQERYALEAEGQAFLEKLDRDGLSRDMTPDENGVYWKTIDYGESHLRIGLVPMADGSYEIRSWRQEREWNQDTSFGNLWTGN